MGVVGRAAERAGEHDSRVSLHHFISLGAEDPASVVPAFCGWEPTTADLQLSRDAGGLIGRHDQSF